MGQVIQFTPRPTQQEQVKQPAEVYSLEDLERLGKVWSVYTCVACNHSVAFKGADLQDVICMACRDSMDFLAFGTLDENEWGEL